MSASRVGFVLAVMAAAMGIAGLLSVCPPGSAQQIPREESPAGDLLAFSVLGQDGKYQQIAVIDSAKRVLAVYHVRLEDGKTELKSVRNIRWDLELEDFEGTGLLPRDIRALVERN